MTEATFAIEKQAIPCCPGLACVIECPPRRFYTHHFLLLCPPRLGLSNRIQLTIDGHKAYLEAVEYAFGADVDYSQMIKVYGSERDRDVRYSPGKIISSEVIRIVGQPDPKHISTSFAERQNWTVRTNMRRYTRLSNGFSRKVQNHAAAVALNYFAYNFIKIYRTLRVSPAMAAGVTDRLWEVADLVSLWKSYEREAEKAA
jgi:hypothetical protein